MTVSTPMRNAPEPSPPTTEMVSTPLLGPTPRPHRLVRPAALTVWLAVVVVLAGFSFADRAPTRPQLAPVAYGSADAVGDTPQLQALRERAARAQADLVRGTQAWEAGRRQLVLMQTQAAQAEAATSAAGKRVTAAQGQLGTLAAAQYRHPMPDAVSVLVGAKDGDIGGRLTALSYLNYVGDDQASVLQRVKVARHEAAARAATARELDQAAARAAKALDTQLSQLRAEAAQSAQDLAAALQKAREEAARKAQEEAARAEAAHKAQEEAARQVRDAAAAVAQQQARAAAAAHQPATPPAAAPSPLALPPSTRPSQRSSRPSAPAAQPATASSSCGASAGRSGGRAWGGYPNGLIPAEALCSIGSGQLLRADAAAAFDRLDAAYSAAFGQSICVTDSYRSYAAQVSVYYRKPSLAAVPGTSNHGWGLAVDLCGGIQTTGSAPYAWMQGHAGSYGWLHPGWAEPGGSKPEPWHWEFGNIS